MFVYEIHFMFVGKWVCMECETDGVSAEALDSQEAAKAASKELSIKTGELLPQRLCTPQGVDNSFPSSTWVPDRK